MLFRSSLNINFITCMYFRTAIYLPFKKLRFPDVDPCTKHAYKSPVVPNNTLLKVQAEFFVVHNSLLQVSFAIQSPRDTLPFFLGILIFRHFSLSRKFS